MKYFNLLREQMAPTLMAAPKRLKYCNPAVKTILTGHTRCYKPNDPYEFSGKELSDHLGLNGCGLEEKNYRVCANVADRVREKRSRKPIHFLILVIDNPHNTTHKPQLHLYSTTFGFIGNRS